ncbi:hypothetical protein BH10PSE6_BH10PSE6_34520 [soil metagenome]
MPHSLLAKVGFISVDVKNSQLLRGRLGDERATRLMHELIDKICRHLAERFSAYTFHRADDGIIVAGFTRTNLAPAARAVLAVQDKVNLSHGHRRNNGGIQTRVAGHFGWTEIKMGRGRPDFLGRTVGKVDRLQKKANGAPLITKESVSRTALRKLLPGVRVELVQVHLKGFGKVEAYKLIREEAVDNY